MAISKEISVAFSDPPVVPLIFIYQTQIKTPKLLDY